MSYPSYLEYFSSSIENVSTATFRIPPTSNNAVSSHQQVQFLLPQNCLLDFRKLRMQFQVTSAGAFTRLPAHASAFFNRISVEVGGQTISSFENANVLDEILRNNLQIEVDPVNEHSTVQRVNDPFSATAIAAAETYPTDDKKAFFSIDMGVLARSIQPSIVNMAMLAQMTITLHLAENAVCISPKSLTNAGGAGTKWTDPDASQGTYQIHNANLIAECLDVADGSLMAMYQQTMQDQGYLELTYENWTSFSDVFNSVTRFSSSAQSLNKIVATFRRGSAVVPLDAGAGGYNAVKGAIPVRGYNNDLIASVASLGFQANALGQPETQGAVYQSAFFTQTAPIVAASLTGGVPKAAQPEPFLNFSVNSVQMPSYNCKASGWYDATKSGWGVSRTKSNSLAEFMLHRFSICQRLDLPDSKALRVMSGLNLKASNANLTLEVTGNNSGATTVDNVLVFLASTNIMRVGIGKQIQILH